MKVLNLEGKEIGSVNIEGKFSQIKPSESLVHFVQDIIQRRIKINRAAHYKAVSAVCRTNKKPFKQKRQGKARQGSRKNIHMIGGAVAFGFDVDKPNGQSKRRKDVKVNKKSKSLAMAHVLKNRYDNNVLHFVDLMDVKVGKTREASACLKDKLNLEKRAALVQLLPKEDVLAFRNIKNLKLLSASSFNIIDFLKSQSIIFDVSSLDNLSKATHLKMEYVRS